MKTRIALIGYGKMGKAIHELIVNEYPETELACIIDSSKNVVEELTKSGAHVAIEFSKPEAAEKNILACFEANVPVVCGTTGWLNRLNDVKQICISKNCSLLYASNFSIGVNLFFELNKYLAKMMSAYPYQAHISETHHVHKKDAPSGTAISLAEQIIINHPAYASWKLHQNEANSICIDAIREDEVPGTHEITYQSEIDEISIKHIAHSRKGFATGAIVAAKWLSGKKGIYEMKDVLFSKSTES